MRRLLKSCIQTFSRMKILKVDGESMSPTLNAGDYVVCKNIKPRSIRPGLIYIINHSDLGRIIKRVHIAEDGQYMLSGDHPSSTPSAVMGPIKKERIVQRALFVISKSGLKKL
ncbi:MAG: hypothetical protein COA43_10710 [Robiginitomaculum sp.]|nr:MAG: hypothetical protein COA43_10710 [Robiginitomaculum sp.]